MTIRNKRFAIFCVEDSAFGDCLFSKVCAVSTRVYGHQQPSFHGRRIVSGIYSI
jgi:hypothetical protein